MPILGNISRANNRKGDRSGRRNFHPCPFAEQQFDLSSLPHSSLSARGMGRTRETTDPAAVLFPLFDVFSRLPKKKAEERTPGAGTSASTSLDPDTPSSSSSSSSSSTTSSPPWLRLFLFLPFIHPSRAHPPTSLG